MIQQGGLRLFPQKPSLDELVHHGVKGMHWGVRKDREGGVHPSQSSAVNVEAGINKTTKEGAVEVAGLIKDRYGYDIKNVKVLDERHPHYQPEYIAFVEDNKLSSKNGNGEGTIFVAPRNLTKELKAAEEGPFPWNAPGTGNVRGLLTHESAHSLFHSGQTVSVGLLGGQKVSGGNIKARDKALRAAEKAARKDGVTIWHSSGYAREAAVREELEAELFSQYHWSTNPPRFVVEWGKTLHQEMGIDPTPFKEVK